MRYFLFPNVICTEQGFRLTIRVEDGRGSIKPRFLSPLIKQDMRGYCIPIGKLSLENPEPLDLLTYTEFSIIMIAKDPI